MLQMLQIICVLLLVLLHNDVPAFWIFLPGMHVEWDGDAFCPKPRPLCICRTDSVEVILQRSNARALLLVGRYITIMVHQHSLQAYHKCHQVVEESLHAPDKKGGDHAI